MARVYLDSLSKCLLQKGLESIGKRGICGGNSVRFGAALTTPYKLLLMSWMRLLT